MPCEFAPAQFRHELGDAIGGGGIVALVAGVLGIRTQARGTENIPAEAVVVLSKHQSAWETVALQQWFPRMVFVLKRELLLLPFLGWRSQLDAACHACQQVEADAARLAEAQRQQALQRDALQAGHAAAGAQLDAWLAAFNAGQPDPLDLAALEALLAFDAAWIKAEADALQALDQAIARADAVRHETRRALDAHAAARPADAPADDTPEAVRLALAGCEAEAERLAQALADVRLALARDDDKRSRSASLRGDIDAQAGKTRVWAQLGELIGSADGKKFRNFAQQLTLDVLLGYANRHLDSLARRYRLERLKDSLGLLVVDQDMGNEVRSVHSLSGGESFLVSLALALALASLSSHRVRVESLFIDEGFGSLDADSLLVAMEALDKLQAQGRKVGVISHVQEMTERIGTRIAVRRGGGGVSRVVVE